MFDGDDIPEDIKKESLLENFYEDICGAMADEDIEEVKNIMSSEKYSGLTKKELDQHTFYCAFLGIDDEDVNIGIILNYLIFEYKIDKKDAFNKINSDPYYQKSINYLHKLFETRELTSDLKKELSITDIPVKQIKL